MGEGPFHFSLLLLVLVVESAPISPRSYTYTDCRWVVVVRQLRKYVFPSSFAPYLGSYVYRFSLRGRSTYRRTIKTVRDCRTKCWRRRGSSNRATISYGRKHSTPPPTTRLSATQSSLRFPSGAHRFDLAPKEHTISSTSLCHTTYCYPVYLPRKSTTSLCVLIVLLLGKWQAKCCLRLTLPVIHNSIVNKSYYQRLSRENPQDFFGPASSHNHFGRIKSPLSESPSFQLKILSIKCVIIHNRLSTAHDHHNRWRWESKPPARVVLQN